MFFEIYEIVDKIGVPKDLLEILAKVELLARKHALTELYNALKDRKEEISKEELLKIIEKEISDIEELIDCYSRNPSLDMKIAGIKPEIR